jgi:type I restriction enzyme, S subunit
MMTEKWPLKTLGELCQIRRGQSPRPIKAHITDDEDGVNWIKIKDAGDDGKYIFKAKQKIHKKSAEKLVVVNDGDFILTNSMSFGRPYIVRTTGCVHDGWLIFTGYQDYLNQDYLYYALNSPYVSNQFEQMARGSTVRNLNIELVKKTILPVPPLEEQQRIVRILDEAFENIEHKNSQVEYKLHKSKEMLQSVFKSIFYEDTEHRFQRLGDIISLEYGKPLPKEDRDPGGAFPVYGANGEKARSNKFYHSTPTIIVGRKGSAGELNLTEGKFWPLDVTYFVTFDEEKYEMKFLYYLLQTLNLPSMAKGVKPGINRNDVYAIEVRIPLKEEQKQIVKKLDLFCELLTQIETACQQESSSIKELGLSILQEAFSGKLTGGISA